MSTPIDGTIPVRTPDIPDEGIEGRWVFAPGAFADEEFPLDLADDATVEGKLYTVDDSVYYGGRLSANVRLGCARCLTTFDYPVREDLEAIYTPKEALLAEGGEEVELSAEEMDVQFFEGEEISLLGPVRDQIILAIPMSPLCNEGCRGLCPTCGADKNTESCSCEENKGDPRFAVLAQLKDKVNPHKG